jgi:hypothetical protein
MGGTPPYTHTLRLVGFQQLNSSQLSNLLQPCGITVELDVNTNNKNVNTKLYNLGMYARKILKLKEASR